MDQASEALMRSAIHDLANTLSGIRGIFELSHPERPLSPRDRDRMEAVLSDGMMVLERARHLAMGTVPDAMIEGGAIWRHLLHEQLGPLGVMFRCPFEIRYEGSSVDDRWPGERLRGFALAVTRQVLPYIQSQPLVITCAATSEAWTLAWTPSTDYPESLQGEPADRPRDISARWALSLAESMHIRLSHSEGCLQATLPRA